MGAIPILLSEIFSGRDHFDWQCGENGDYTLTVEPDVLVNLREDRLDSRVCLYASPGYLPGALPIFESRAPVSVALASLQCLPEAELEFRYSSETGLALLVLCADRAALRITNFPEVLLEFVDIYYSWAESLLAQPVVDEGNEDPFPDEPVFPFNLV